MSTVKVAVLGACGWMGKVHTMAYRDLPLVFGTANGRAEVAWLIDSDAARLAEIVAELPGARTSGDWRDAIADPEVDLIDICLPDKLHHEVAKAALLAGKHVYCEKPLTDTATKARELAAIASGKGLITRVGHSYLRNPVHDLAKEIIDGGEIGEIMMFRAQQHIDTFGDPAAPFMWRADGDLAPTGIVGDTGTHVFSILDRLVGRVSSLVAEWIDLYFVPNGHTDDPEVPRVRSVVDWVARRPAIDWLPYEVRAAEGIFTVDERVAAAGDWLAAEAAKIPADPAADPDEVMAAFRA